jgi:hypothetical protein
VESLCTLRQLKLFWTVSRTNPAGCTLCVRLRSFFRLNAARESLECCLLTNTIEHVFRRIIVNVQRFEEIINGREYKIEVSNVGADKWRAQIARLPGGSAALMPFYGRTPDEAARHLSSWLLLAHNRAADASRKG